MVIRAITIIVTKNINNKDTYWEWKNAESKTGGDNKKETNNGDERQEKRGQRSENNEGHDAWGDEAHALLWSKNLVASFHSRC